MIFSLFFSFCSNHQNNEWNLAQPFFSSGVTYFTPTFETQPIIVILPIAFHVSLLQIKQDKRHNEMKEN